MSNRRRPRTTYLAPAPAFDKFWGPNYSGPAMAGSGTLAEQVGANQALMEFFKGMLDHRWEVMQRQAEARIQRVNDFRDQRLSMDRYSFQHSNTMDESAYRDALKDGVGPLSDWRSNDLFNQGAYHASGTNPSGVSPVGNTVGPALPGHESASETYQQSPELMDDARRRLAESSKNDQMVKVDDGNGQYHYAKIGPDGQPVQDGPYSGDSLWDKANRALQPVNDALEPAKDPLLWALDKISRPVYAVNAGMKYGFAQDQDTNTFTAKDFFTNGLIGEISGKSLWDTADEIAHNPVDFGKGFYEAMWDGFTEKNGPTLYQSVVAQNAKMDPSHNMYDDPKHQALFGFAGDVVNDPLNFAGVGLAKGSVTAVEHSKDLMSLSEEVAKAAPAIKGREFVVGGTGEATVNATHTPVDAARIYDMLGGNFPKPRNAGERLYQLQHVHQGVENVVKILNDTPITETRAASKGIEALGNAVRAQREAVLKSFGDETVLDGLRRELEIKISKGDATPADLDNLEHTLNVSKIAALLPDAGVHEKSLNEIASKLGFGQTKKGQPSPYENLVKAIEDGTIDPAKKRMAEEQIYALKTKSLDEVIGEHVKNDYRFWSQDLKGLYKESSRHAWQDRTFSDLARSSMTMERDLKSARKGLATMIREGANPEHIANKEASIKRLELRKMREDQAKNYIHADTVIRLLKSKIAKGDAIYNDPEFAKGAEKLLKQVKGELEQIKSGKRANFGYTGINKGRDEEWIKNNEIGSSGSKSTEVKQYSADDVINQVARHGLSRNIPSIFMKRAKGGGKYFDVKLVKWYLKKPRSQWPQDQKIREFLDKINEKIDAARAEGKLVDTEHYGATETNHSVPGHDLPTDFVDRHGNFDPAATEPHPAFYDRVSHLEHMVKTLEHQLESVKGLSKPERRMLMNAPDSFLKDGGLDMEMLSKHIKFSSGKEFYLVKTGDAATDKWLEDVKTTMYRTYLAKFKEVHDPLARRIREDEAAKRATLKNANEKADQHLTVGNENGKLTPEQYAKTVMKDTEKSKGVLDFKARDQAIAHASKEAREYAIHSIERDFKNSTLSTHSYDSELKLAAPVGAHSTEGDLLDVLAWKRGDEYKNAWHAAQLEKVGASDEKVKALDAQLEELRKQHTIAKASEDALRKQAIEGRKILEKRLREEAVLKVAGAKLAAQNRALTVNILGAGAFKIPTTESLFKAAEKAGGVPLIKRSRQIMANMFKSPVSQLPEELHLAYLRAMNNTPEIIAIHARELMDKMGHIPEPERVANFKSWLEAPTGDPGTNMAIQEVLDPLVPYFNGTVKVGEHKLIPADINRYLPEEYRINGKKLDVVFKTPQQLIRAMKDGKGNLKELQDPYRIAWTTRIAIEKAMARKGLEGTIAETFGVRTGRFVNEAGHPVGKYFDNETIDTLDKLKGLGWETIPRLNSTHYFPPEIVQGVNRMLDLMEPRNINGFGKFVDHATGYWKTSVTVYNPGYYTRNGIGELMSSWLAGVNNPKHYANAMKVMRYVRQDGRELEALKSHMPLLDLGDVPSNAALGNKVVARLKNGKEITAEQAWVAYHDQGLKTGFFSTEFDAHFNKAGDAIRSGPLGKASDFHQWMRSNGEDYEDYLRMGHFLHSLENSGAHDLSTAAAHAAKDIRKYHFDYQDFTKFEKSVMLRAFPFYKWTRKAAPLMMTMLFTKPGKMMMYPKTMNSLSNMMSSGDLADNNGFAPNYEGIVPGWMQDMWAYKVMEGGPGGLDAGTGDAYMNVATPQMDALKAVTSPVSAGTQLFNPLFKVPIEAGLGRTLDSQHLPIDGTSDQIKHIFRATPQTAMGVKSMDSSDKGNAWLSFVTGLGFYGNTKTRQQAQIFNQAGD